MQYFYVNDEERSKSITQLNENGPWKCNISFEEVKKYHFKKNRKKRQEQVKEQIKMLKKIKKKEKLEKLKNELNTKTPEEKIAFKKNKKQREIKKIKDIFEKICEKKLQKDILFLKILIGMI